MIFTNAPSNKSFDRSANIVAFMCATWMRAALNARPVNASVGPVLGYARVDWEAGLDKRRFEVVLIEKES